ncbi:MAG: NUDIX hydrolase [Candidatus Izimaplasma sp.]|nr:NUDIX hydrolase [Candidatus Izimaplasma bacterium]
MKFIEKTISSKLVYSNSFLDLYEDEVLLPNNKKSKRIYASHLGAAAVLPITKDNKIVLTKQYRYPIKAISIEIPAGKKDFAGEEGIDCVKRELEEETNYTSNNIQLLLKTHNCVGYSNEAIELYIAYDCEYVKDIRKSDEDEFIEAVVYSVEEVIKMIEDGIITDAKTIITIQSYLLNKQ